jgi:hypothetical protein
MKKYLFPVLALLVLGLSACKQDSGDSGIPTGTLGDKPIPAAGQIYDYDKDGNPVASTTTATVEAYIGKTKIADGAITNGTFDIEIPVPGAELLSPLSDMLDDKNFDAWANPAADPSDVNGGVLKLRTTNGNSIEKVVESGTKSAGSYESIDYIYVDQDVTVTLGGINNTFTDVDGITWTKKTINTTLKLTKGWNTLYSKSTWSSSGSTGTENSAISVANPTLPWVIYYK